MVEVMCHHIDDSDEEGQSKGTPLSSTIKFNKPVPPWINGRCYAIDTKQRLPHKIHIILALKHLIGTESQVLD